MDMPASTQVNESKIVTFLLLEDIAYLGVNMSQTNESNNKCICF